MIEFKAWPKIPRPENETFAVTEKIDGTNSCVIIDTENNVAAQSRTRIITPKDDNFGFAKWVEENKKELVKLGPGHHYGEWWGAGIQRKYDLDHKRFSLFAWWTPEEQMPKCCHRIPLINQKATRNDLVEILNDLELNGSKAAPGFLKPEGIIVKSNISNQRYKLFCAGE